MPTLTVTNAYGLNTDDIDIGHLQFSDLVVATGTTYSVNFEGEVTTFLGSGFTYNSAYIPTGGVVTRVTDTYLGQQVFDLTGLNIPATSFVTWALTGDNASMMRTLFGGADSISGGALGDLLRGYDGADTIFGGDGGDGLDGGAGNDSISAGPGNDIVLGGEGTNYLRGDDGNDSIVGGSGFDDINGNMGNDTCVSGGGDDWVVGGKDNDSLMGSAGQNLVYGNLGADTCDGGAGNDIVRGGQDNDSCLGGAGDDFVSGDKGDDTLVGGAGADSFHTFGDAGIDRVLDFHISEGDRVQLDPGTQYTVSQVGADTVINMTGGGQMILVGVQMSTLTGAWIFGA